jgi:hypothetical protein
LKHFYTYGLYVFIETEHRDYKCNLRKFDQYFKGGKIVKTFDELFDGWHNERYLDQCFYNLQEKFDCGGITEEEWEKVSKKYYEVKEKYASQRKQIEGEN